MSEDKRRQIDAIDAIYSLLDQVENLHKKIDIVDSNIKLLNNKIAKLSKTINTAPSKQPSAAIPTASPVAPDKDSRKVAGQLTIGNIKTFGKIANKNGEPIPGVEINIYNQEGQVIKNKNTDHEGYWEVRLPAGVFGVEYKRKGFKAVNLNIELDNTMKEFEVGS